MRGGSPVEAIPAPAAILSCSTSFMRQFMQIPLDLVDLLEFSLTQPIPSGTLCSA